MIKDTGEQPDEDIHRVWSGRVLSTGNSVLIESGCIPLLIHGYYVNQPRSSPNVYFWGFYGGVIM